MRTVRKLFWGKLADILVDAIHLAEAASLFCHGRWVEAIEVAKDID